MMHLRRFFLVFAISQCLALASPVLAQTADANKPEISLQVATEDNQKIIRATVTAAGKPLANATVNFFVKRTFGNLDIGHDQTLDDGTAAVPFPDSLPNGTTGQIQVFAVITAPPQYSSGRVEATFDGARVIPPEPDALPRALWAPHAPPVLILIIITLLTLVWGTYTYVVVQLIILIRKREIQ